MKQFPDQKYENFKPKSAELLYDTTDVEIDEDMSQYT